MKKLYLLSVVIAVILFSSSALAASNPFADIPSGHWAYDALAQLAADGVVSGYPDGTFRGVKPCTRYEAASLVARALAKADVDKTSESDMELLRKLTMEFKDELGALGVRVDGLDSRVSALEERLGGWKLTGVFMFDANFTKEGWYNSNGADTEFDKNLLLFNLTKYIDENTFFTTVWRTGFFVDGNGRGDGSLESPITFVQTKLPFDIDFRVGRWFEDFEQMNGLYWSQHEMNSLYGSYYTDGFRFHKSFGAFDATAFVGRNARHDDLMLTKLGGGVTPVSGDTAFGDYMNYVLYLQWQPNEKFKFGGTANWWLADGGKADDYDLGLAIYGLYADYAFTPVIDLKGLYYWQKLDDGFTRLDEYTPRLNGVADSSPNAWKIILDVKQQALRFTSLWLEYSEADNSFVLFNNQHVMNWGERDLTPSVTDNRPFGWDGTTKIWMIGAEQRWNDKWSTFEKYAKADYGKDWVDVAENFTIGVTYQYTPAVAFQLFYDYLDFGDGASDPLDTRNYRTGTDHILKFRTSVAF